MHKRIEGFVPTNNLPGKTGHLASLEELLAQMKVAGANEEALTYCLRNSFDECYLLPFYVTEAPVTTENGTPPHRWRSAGNCYFHYEQHRYRNEDNDVIYNIILTVAIARVRSDTEN